MSQEGREYVASMNATKSGTAEQARVMQNDLDIQQGVLDELSWDPQVAPNEIGVVVNDGVVTLTGWVDTYTKRLAAVEAALRVRDVHAVANELEIRLPSMTERLDSDIAAAALHTLVWDATIPTGDIDLTVSKGWVTIKGQVPWGYQRLEAERVVQRLAGVKGVSNLLIVKPQAAPADITASITRALERQAEVDAKGITVDVHGTTVTLRGRVRSYAEKQAAGGTAWSAPGITVVENQLVVGF